MGHAWMLCPFPGLVGCCAVSYVMQSRYTVVAGFLHRAPVCRLSRCKHRVPSEYTGRSHSCRAARYIREHCYSGLFRRLVFTHKPNWISMSEQMPVIAKRVESSFCLSMTCELHDNRSDRSRQVGKPTLWVRQHSRDSCRIVADCSERHRPHNCTLLAFLFGRHSGSGSSYGINATFATLLSHALSHRIQ